VYHISSMPIQFILRLIARFQHYYFITIYLHHKFSKSVQSETYNTLITYE
jgi:hypothetical protein